MGSEFSYEDIGGQQIEKYDYKLISQTDKEWIVESKPKTKSGYSKLITNISKELNNPTQVQYFDRRGDLLKISKLENFKSYSVGSKKFNIADKIIMENKQTKKKSILAWKKRKLGLKLKDKDFKSSKLK